MPTIQFGGAISGIDTRSIVDALMQAERLPLTRLQQRRTELENRQKAYSKLSGLLTELLSKAKAFTVNGIAASKSASVSEPTRFGATATTSAASGTYQIIVDRLATPTKATSTAAVGTAVTNTAQTLASLNLPGSVSAGTVSLAVDGSIVTATIGDPASTTLQSAIDAIGAAIQTKVQATDPGATVTASVSGNKLQFAISGAAGSHTVKFGAAGDTSNALTIFGLSSLESQTFATGSPILAASSLGVVRTTVALDSAGLTGLTSTATGKVTINGVEIAYDTTTDTLSDVLTRINNSAAGVIASLDRTNDKVILQHKTAGATVMNVADTSGTLAAGLKLGPGTTTAQALGQSSRIYVDGREVVADTNRVTTAIDGLTLDLLTTDPAAVTLTVGADRTTARKAVSDFVAAFNAVANELETVTANAPGKAKGILAAEAGVRDLLNGLRSTALAVAPSLSGAIRSLGDLGVSTGVIGSAVGTTKRLVFDETKFDKAVDLDPARVAQLLNSADGAIKPLVDRLTALTGANGLIEANTKGIAEELPRLSAREADLERRIEAKRIAIERKYTALERQLALLQSQNQQVGAQAASLNEK
jgi:flagellar hook-associated protein 2